MGATLVGPQAIREYVARMRERYERAGREAKGGLLDEVCEVTGYHRKAVIRRLQRPAVRRPRPQGPWKPQNGFHSDHTPLLLRRLR